MGVGPRASPLMPRGGSGATDLAVALLSVSAFIQDVACMRLHVRA